MNKQQKKIAKKLPTKRNNKHGDEPLKDSDLPVNDEEDDDIRKGYENDDKDIKEAEDKGDYKRAIEVAESTCTSLEAKEKEAADYINDLIYISKDDEAWRRWHKDERHKYIDIKSLISELEGKLRAIRTQKEKYEKKIEDFKKKLADKQAEEVDEPAKPHISKSWEEFLKDYEKELPASFPTGSDGKGYDEWLTVLRYYQSGATDKKRLNNYTKKKDAKSTTTLNKIVEKLIERNKANKKDPPKKVKKVKVPKKKAEELTVKDLETPETKPVIDPDKHAKIKEDLEKSQIPEDYKKSMWNKAETMKSLVDQGKRDAQQYIDICEEIKFIEALEKDERYYPETIARLNELLDEWLALPDDEQKKYHEIRNAMNDEREKLKMHHTQTMPVKDADKPTVKDVVTEIPGTDAIESNKLAEECRELIKSLTEVLVHATENNDDKTAKKMIELISRIKFVGSVGQYVHENFNDPKKRHDIEKALEEADLIINGPEKLIKKTQEKKRPPTAKLERSTSALKSVDKVPTKTKAPTKPRAASGSKKISGEKPESTEALKEKSAHYKYLLIEKPMMREEFNSYNMDNYLSSLEERFEEKSRDPAFNKLSNTEKDKVIREILTMKDIKYDKMRTAISNEINKDPEKFKTWFNTTVAPLLGAEINQLAKNATLSKVKTTGITGMKFVFKDKEKKAEPEPTPAPAPAPKPMKIGKSKKSGGIMKGASVGNAKTFFSYDIHEIFKIIESKLHLTLSKYAKLSIEALIYNATDEIINSHGCSDSGHGSSIYDDIVSDVEDYINQHSKSSETFHFMGQRRQQFITILKSEVKNNKQQRNRDMDDRIAALSNFI